MKEVFDQKQENINNIAKEWNEYKEKRIRDKTANAEEFNDLNAQVNLLTDELEEQKNFKDEAD